MVILLIKLIIKTICENRFNTCIMLSDQLIAIKFNI